MNPTSTLTRYLRGRPRRVLSLSAVAASTLGLVACGSSSSSSSTGPASTSSKVIHIGLIHDAVVNDGGYGQAMLQALHTALDRVGQQHFVLDSIVQRVPYTAQMTATAESVLAKDDVLVDIAAGGALVYTACAAAPQKHCLEYYAVGKPPANVSGFYIDQAPFYYIEGVAAGKLTKTGDVGFVSALKLNELVAYQNSFALGCQSVRPDCKLHVIYVNSFDNPPAEVEAANTLIDGGADVLTDFANDPSVLQTAAKRGVWAFGLYTNQLNIAPAHYVTSQVTEPAVEMSFEEALRDLVDGKPIPYSSNPPNGMLFGGPPMDFPLSRWGPNVPSSVVIAATSVWRRLSSGWSPYVGPLYDSTGRLRVRKGQTIGIRSQFVYSGWNWNVRGVLGGG